MIISRDRNEIAMPDGWAVYFDGELVFSADEDKWETIGPGIARIMKGRSIMTKSTPYDSQPASYWFTDRELLNITRVGLSRIYTGRDSEASEGMREAARQALAVLEGRASFDDLGPRYAVRGHYHDASGYENTLCTCPDPGRYAPVPDYDPEESE